MSFQIDIDSALDEKCIDDDDGTAADSENKYSDSASNVEDRQPKNGHCFCEIDDDFDFISTVGI